MVNHIHLHLIFIYNLFMLSQLSHVIYNFSFFMNKFYIIWSSKFNQISILDFSLLLTLDGYLKLFINQTLCPKQKNYHYKANKVQ